MTPLTRSFDLSHEHPALPASGPRLWRLIFGLACALAAAVLIGSHLVNPWWQGATVSEVGFVSALLLIVGIASVVQALHSDLFRLHSASIHPNGMQLQWSHAPQLTGPLITDQRFVRWDEVFSIHWSEGQQDHDFRQLLELTLHQPLARHRNHLQLLVSEGRNLDRCIALMALLPESTARPDWIERAQHVADTRPSMD
jgi:hypothetical protein